MATTFKQIDAVILGIICKDMFGATVEDVQGETGNNGNYASTTPVPFGFAYGGLPASGAGGGEKGDSGKPLLSDKSLKANPDYPSLCGYGGSQLNAGKGFVNGGFGFGGGHNGSSVTCGGGSGWFGGGSSYAGAGGGGGSGFVNTFTGEEPDWYIPPSNEYYCFIGKSEWAQGVNNGDGKCIINGTTYPYTGKVKAVVVQGMTTIECYGAQGGSIADLWDYSGGLGGYTKGEFNFATPTTLYVYVGGQGGSAGNAGWNGGGLGSGGCSSGGGATDVRWEGDADGIYWNNYLASRFIVAGGGGGQGRSGSDYDFFSPTNIKDAIAASPSGNLVETGGIATGKQLYLTNDSTIVKADITYQTTLDTDGTEPITVNLFVDGVKRALTNISAVSGGSSQTATFEFNKFLSANSDLVWSTLEITIESKLDLIIPPKGIVIRLVTKKRPNDISPTVIPMVAKTKGFLSVSSSTWFYMVEGQRPISVDYLESKLGVSASTVITMVDIAVPPSIDKLVSYAGVTGETSILLKGDSLPISLSNLESSIELSGNTVIVLKDIPLPLSVSNLVSNYVVKAGTRVSIKDIPVPPNLESMISKLGVMGETVLKTNK